jgi:hypothetical protein
LHEAGEIAIAKPVFPSLNRPKGLFIKPFAQRRELHRKLIARKT